MTDFFVRDGEIYWKGLWFPRLQRLAEVRRDNRSEGSDMSRESYWEDEAPYYRPLGKRSRRKVSRKARLCDIGQGDAAVIQAGEAYYQAVFTLDGVFTISNACVKCNCGKHPDRVAHG